MKRRVSSPQNGYVEISGVPDVHLSIDEATVLLGLLDLLLPPSAAADPAILALTDRSRTRLAGAISSSLNTIQALRAL